MPPTGSGKRAVAADRLSDRRRRADAERSIAAIIDAAFDCLCEDSDVSMSAIARAAGVGRVTLYTHFPTREALLAEVVRRAVEQAAAALDAEAPDEGPAREALVRLVRPGWRVLDRCRRLAAAARDLPPERLHDVHNLVLDRVERLVARGQDEGAFRIDVPRAWLVTTIYSLMHAVVQEVDAGRLSHGEVGVVLETTLLPAIERPTTGSGREEDRNETGANGQGAAG